jgi:ribosomal-protein-alanine N-acetyltransferase
MLSFAVPTANEDCVAIATEGSAVALELHAPPSGFSTEHLRLRCLRLSDATDYFSFSSCAEVTRYLPWRTHRQIDEAVADIEAYLRGEQENRFTWGVTVAGADRLVGLVGCELCNGGMGVGYILHADVWGRGYAAEAVSALLSWAEQRSDIALAWAVCDAENISSMKVLSKIGFVDSGVPYLMSCPNLSNSERKACVYARRCGTYGAG